MEEKLSINIKIADRFYPLKIDRKEEEKIRKSVKMINEKISQYMQKYSDKDTFDFLAMAALQFASKYIESDSESNYDFVKEEIRQVNRELEAYIEKNK